MDICIELLFFLISSFDHRLIRKERKKKKKLSDHTDNLILLVETR